MLVDVISIKAFRTLCSEKLCAAFSDVVLNGRRRAQSRERLEQTLRNVG